MRTSYFLLFFGVFALAGVSAQAQIANGSFATGDLTDWSQLGAPTVDSTNVPNDASFAALIQSTNSISTSSFGDPGPVNSADADTLTDINAKLGTSISANGANSGEGIYQTFTLSVPTEVTFETSFASYDSSGVNNKDDSAGYVLNGNYVQLYTSPLSFPDTTPTSYALQSVLLPAGIDTLGFVVYNTYDDTFDSEMWVGDVALAPEPSTWLLALVGLGLIAGLYRFALRPADNRVE